MVARVNRSPTRAIRASKNDRSTNRSLAESRNGVPVFFRRRDQDAFFAITAHRKITRSSLVASIGSRLSGGRTTRRGLLYVDGQARSDDQLRDNCILRAVQGTTLSSLPHPDARFRHSSLSPSVRVRVHPSIHSPPRCPFARLFIEQSSRRGC